MLPTVEEHREMLDGRSERKTTLVYSSIRLQ